MINVSVTQLEVEIAGLACTPEMLPVATGAGFVYNLESTLKSICLTTGCSFVGDAFAAACCQASGCVLN